MIMVEKINDTEFNNIINSSDKVVVKYFANWCGTCRLFAPKYARISEKEEFKGIRFLDINAEENPVARQFAGVSNLPFFAVIKNGQLLAADTSAKEEGVENLVRKLL
jgi:thioredoxin 1